MLLPLNRRGNVYHLHKQTSICDALARFGFHLYNLKTVKNIHGGVLLLVKLQAKVCNGSFQIRIFLI